MNSNIKGGMNMRNDRPLYSYYDAGLFGRKIIHDRDDEGKFEKDFKNFVESRFAKGRIVLVDSKVEELEFKVPHDYEDILICPLFDCLRYLESAPDRFLCLTLGTSVSFPRVNLEVITAKEVELAEVHACCFNTEDNALSIEYARISLYHVECAEKRCKLIARYEKNKEILEDSLKPGEKLMDPASYNSVGDWMRDGRAEFELIPLPTCFAVSQIEKRLGLKWPESYYYLHRNDAVISEEGVHIINLGKAKLWMGGEDKPEKPARAAKKRS